jgi:hypothetical protein
MVRDMNHDLIAAGHPALRFDLLLYLDNLPKHWDSAGPAEQTFDESAIRVREVARAVNLSAALELSAQRAADHLRSKQADSWLGAPVPWPELADYDCYSCHQALKFRPADAPVVSSGVPTWNAWYTLRQLPISDTAMSGLAPGRSEASRIATLIPPKAEEWRTKAQEMSAGSPNPVKRLDSIAADLHGASDIDWQEAALQYLRLEAVARDLSKQAATATLGQQITGQLPGIELLLRFDPSPTSDQRARVHSPAQFDAERFRTEMLRVVRPSPGTSEAAQSLKIPLPSSVASQP